MSSPLSAAWLAAALCLPLTCSAAVARTPNVSRTAAVTLNFPDTDIDAAARAMTAITGRQVMVDPRVKGKITLYTDDLVSVEHAWSLFVVAL